MFKKAKPFDPPLSFAPEVQDFMRETYPKATSILEYGSGGSTLLAASLGKPVISIESDPNWAAQMNGKIKTDFPEANAKVLHKDMGKIGAWGKPVNAKNAVNYHAYPMSIWDAPDFEQPDVILIDGRLRPACFCTAIMRLTQPATILFDDYRDRPRYQIVERFMTPTRMVEKMAVFAYEPRAIPPADFGWMIPTFFQTSYAGDKNRPEGG